MRTLPLVLLASLLSPIGLAEDSPDADFLEYLGRWEETDAEWIEVSNWTTENAGEQDAPETTAEERSDDDTES